MGCSKVTYYGNILIDLTADTVSPENLISGVTAHNAAGDLITGTAKQQVIVGYLDSYHDLTLSGVSQTLDNTTWVLDDAPLSISGTTVIIGG